MKRAWIGAAALAGALAVESPSGAEVARLSQMSLGFTYFNRPSATAAEHARDIVDCAGLAGGVRSMEAIRAGDTVFSPASFAAVGQRTERALATASLENCMVVRGWRVVKLANDEGRMLADLPAADLAKRLEPWIGAETPHGEIVRRWDNDAARYASQRYDTSPARTKNGQLSLAAAAPELRQLPPPGLHEPRSPWVNPLWPREPLKPTELAGVRADAGVLLVEITGDNGHAGFGLVLNRQGADKDSWPSMTDHAPDKLYVGRPGLFHHGIVAYVMPPGRWRLYGIGFGPTLNLCLGSPSFEIKAGEVLYAGAFDLSAEEMTPNLDLAPANAWLGDGGKPVTAAAYTNGSRGPCGDNSIYALEFKGAPFEPGYAWGSRAATAK